MSGWLAALIGAAAGVLAAWGVGGGTLLLLAMTLLLDVPAETAQRINLLFFLPTAITALLRYRKQGYLRRELLRPLIAVGCAAAAVAAFAAPGIDTALLRRPFGVLLLAAAASLLWQERPRKKSSS